MKKIGSVILIVITMVVVGVSGYFIFRRDTLEHRQIQLYTTIKSQLIEQPNYQSSSNLVSFAFQKQVVWGKYVVTITVENATERLDNLVILVINAAEQIVESDRYYPSLGIFDNVGYDLVPPQTTIVNSKEKKGFNFTFQSLDDVDSVLLYIQYENQESEIIQLYYSIDISMS